MLDVWPRPGYCGLPVRDRSHIPSSLGPVFVEKLQSGEGKNAVKQVVVRETEADSVVF